jgi:hypothetical protein
MNPAVITPSHLGLTSVVVPFSGGARNCVFTTCFDGEGSIQTFCLLLALMPGFT